MKGFRNIVDMSQIDDIKISKECILDGVLVVFVGFIATVLGVEQECIPMGRSINMYEFYRDFEVSLGDVIPSMRGDVTRCVGVESKGCCSFDLTREIVLLSPIDSSGHTSEGPIQLDCCQVVSISSTCEGSVKPDLC
jgi:hypothetical protein